MSKYIPKNIVLQTSVDTYYICLQTFIATSRLRNLPFNERVQMPIELNGGEFSTKKF